MPKALHIVVKGMWLWKSWKIVLGSSLSLLGRLCCWPGHVTVLWVFECLWYAWDLGERKSLVLLVSGSRCATVCG